MSKVGYLASEMPIFISMTSELASYFLGLVSYLLFLSSTATSNTHT